MSTGCRTSLGAAVFVLAIVVAVAAGAGSAERWRALADRVSADGIRRHTVVLGGDALEGRAPGSRGGRLAAAYIAAALEKLGVEPFGDERSFSQRVPLVGTRPLEDSRLQLSGLGERRDLRLGEEYLLHSTGAQTWLPQPTPLVFVGYGIVAPEFDHNDYADVDVRGKVAVFLAGEPDSNDPAYFAGTEPTVYSAVESKVRLALSRGAVASVFLPRRFEDGGPRWSRLRQEYSFEHINLAASVPSHLALLLHPEVARDLFAEALYDFEQVLSMERRQVLRSFHLPMSLSFEGNFRTRAFVAENIVGRIEGRGARSARDAVVVTAHYDHLGRGPAVQGDVIYNGVVDNAIGAAALLEMSRVLASAAHRPRRSVIVLFTTAEEEGNLGARRFLEHPPIPLSSMAANINIDGLAFQGDFSDVVGIGAELSDLGGLLDRAARQRGLEVGRPDEVAHGRAAFQRSEQVVFAEAGIPSLLINEGLSRHHLTRQEALDEIVEWFRTRYHSPFDDLTQPLDFEAGRKHAALILTLVLITADAPTPPQWKAGSPYAYRRLLTLAEKQGAVPGRRR